MNKADYKNSITNLSNSIISHFGVKPFHNTIPEVDERLKGKKKVLVFLFDGMGKAILEKNLKEDSFFRSHIIHNITSTIPPTTVAATTSMLSAKYPIETGWLGWTLYFKDINKNVTVFKNEDDDTGEKLPGENIMQKECPYTNIAELINKANNKEIAKIIMGFPVDNKNKRVKHLRSFVKYAFEETSKKEEAFTYAYWVYPDMMMHMLGTNRWMVKRNIKRIQKYVKRYSSKYNDVTTLIIADHGMKDVKWEDISIHQDLIDTLIRPVSIEKRTMNFFVKDGRKEEFENLFNKYYGLHYELKNKEQVLEEKIFGDAKPNKCSLDFIGDYVAFALDDLSLEWKQKESKHVPFKAHHAGTTKDELEVSIIAIN